MKGLKDIGLQTFLDERYAGRGGFARFKDVVEREWPRVAIAKEFNVSRQQVYEWIRAFNQLEGK